MSRFNKESALNSDRTELCVFKFSPQACRTSPGPDHCSSNPLLLSDLVLGTKLARRRKEPRGRRRARASCFGSDSRASDQTSQRAEPNQRSASPSARVQGARLPAVGGNQRSSARSAPQPPLYTRGVTRYCNVGLHAPSHERAVVFDDRKQVTSPSRCHQPT